MQKDCIASTETRHGKRRCIESSRFRFRRRELNSHAFSLVNRLQHRISQAIYSNCRGFPLVQSSYPHAQVGPHGTENFAMTLYRPARASVFNSSSMTRTTATVEVNIKMSILETRAATPHGEQDYPVFWLSSGRCSRLGIEYGGGGGCIQDRQ
ncbi:hypothetical protein SMAC4_13495 [Sordaria macrospora]|uniref:uncharacterized protein n=1 Tax=Sordaria macrospora TaxID=5147 RepID=UPI002B2D4B52|nr:hypothetical protein SMAC4_13495 [Sordaria macrospora]